VGVVAPGWEIPRGTGPPTGVPPGVSVIVALATVMVVLVVGTEIARVVPNPTNVSDAAVDGGYGLGSLNMVKRYYRNKRDETNSN
jgi:hypothetical protein